MSSKNWANEANLPRETDEAIKEYLTEEAKTPDIYLRVGKFGNPLALGARKPQFKSGHADIQSSPID